MYIHVHYYSDSVLTHMYILVPSSYRSFTRSSKNGQLLFTILKL